MFGTYFNNDIAINTSVLGEDSAGGDAPYWGHTFITSQIDATTIVTQKCEENGGEMDEESGEEIVEKNNTAFNITMSELGFIVVVKEKD